MLSFPSSAHVTLFIRFPSYQHYHIVPSILLCKILMFYMYFMVKKASATHRPKSSPPRGGVMLPFLQLAHMVDVPQHMGWGRVMLPFWQLAHMHGRCSATHGVGGGGDVTVLATCTHGRCSAPHGAGGVTLPCWQLAHMVGVPQHMGRVG